jgi:DNA primase
MGKEIKRLFIPEGVADSIYLNAIGYDSISPGQSNLTDHQIQLIDKYFGKGLNIYLFFDNDDHQIGQNNSIRKAYRLWQFGFRKIFILRTATGMGKDLTDCAVKLDNLPILKHLLDMWIKEAYKFSPASNSDLNVLLESDLYTENDILSIDPREIGYYLNNLKELSQIKNRFGFSNSSEFKAIPKSNVKLIKEMMDIVNKPTSLNKAVDASEPEPITKDLPKENTDEPSQNLRFNNLSDKQVFRLSEKFDDTTIKIIDEFLSQKQVNCIIGMLRKNKDLDINDFLKSSRYKGEPIETQKTISMDSKDYNIAEDTSLTKCDKGSNDMPF